MSTIIKFENDLPNNNCRFGVYLKDYISEMFYRLCVKFCTDYNPGYFLDCSGKCDLNNDNSRYIVTNYEHIFYMAEKSKLKVFVEEKNAKNNTHYLISIDFVLDILDDDKKKYIVEEVNKLCEKLNTEMEKITYEYEYENNLFEYNERQTQMN